MSRKLASIQRIYEVVPIEGADRIELVRMQSIADDLGAGGRGGY